MLLVLLFVAVSALPFITKYEENGDSLLSSFCMTTLQQLFVSNIMLTNYYYATDSTDCLPYLNPAPHLDALSLFHFVSFKPLQEMDLDILIQNKAVINAESIEYPNSEVHDPLILSSINYSADLAVYLSLYALKCVAGNENEKTSGLSLTDMDIDSFGFEDDPSFMKLIRDHINSDCEQTDSLSSSRFNLLKSNLLPFQSLFTYLTGKGHYLVSKPESEDLLMAFIDQASDFIKKREKLGLITPVSSDDGSKRLKASASSSGISKARSILSVLSDHCQLLQRTKDQAERLTLWSQVDDMKLELLDTLLSLSVIPRVYHQYASSKPPYFVLLRNPFTQLMYSLHFIVPFTEDASQKGSYRIKEILSRICYIR